MSVKKTNLEKEFEQRLEQHADELKWLYTELYGENAWYDGLIENMKTWYLKRKASLRKMDKAREQDPSWYRGNQFLGMMMYVDAFADNLKGVKEHIDYVHECHVNYLHLMPLLASPKGKSDGGYAVADFGKVQENLGTMEDLEELADICHENGISVCLDFVMNHTSEDHEWAVRARNGEQQYMDYYFFYDNHDIPAMFEKTVPQVFPTTAPGNFTWLPKQQKYVMTTFYPYQWDLNYRNPAVFNEMVYNMLNLTDKGIDIIRIDAVPYIWKELGTNCRNLPQVHSIVRMMRIICEIVCPGVLLLGEVVMEPEKVVPYFGSVEKPECHMLYNVTTMASTWHTVATKNIRLLKHQMDTISNLPKDYVFLNYLRCHDDIGWGLDYAYLRNFGVDEVAHKKFLSDYFTGIFQGSMARGQLYNSDPTSGDARQCGTTASLCGIEAADYICDDEELEKAIACDLMLHTYMLTQSGIPVIYSGDEIGQQNDYTYRRSSDADRAADSRYVHRGKFDWEKAAKRHEAGTIQNQLFEGLEKIETIRKQYDVFRSDASMWTIETYDDSILGLVRTYGTERLVALFNFSGERRTAWIQEGGEYTDLISGEKMRADHVGMEPYKAYWLHMHW